MPHDIQRVAVLGAGNGGKTTALDLALTHGLAVRLFELPAFASRAFSSLARDLDSGRPLLRGNTPALHGAATLEYAGDDVNEALGLKHGAAALVDTVFVCTTVQAQKAMAYLVGVAVREWPKGRKLPLVVLNPGSTGGSLVFVKEWRAMGLVEMPVVAEFGTLTYGTRASGSEVDCAVKVQRVSYGVFPAARKAELGGCLEKIFPGLFYCPTVLAAGLSNANPVIHPAITLLNLGRMEREGEKMFFYKDGATPLVSRLIEAVDKERLAIMLALQYGDVAVPDHTNSKLQGYAESDESYYACFGLGKGFGAFRCPPVGTDLTQHRYFQEDIGCGLVFFHDLGAALGVATPACDAVIAMGSVIAMEDFLGKAEKTLETLGLEGMNAEEMRAFLVEGCVLEN